MHEALLTEAATEKPPKPETTDPRSSSTSSTSSSSSSSTSSSTEASSVVKSSGRNPASISVSNRSRDSTCFRGRTYLLVNLVEQ